MTTATIKERLELKKHINSKVKGPNKKAVQAALFDGAIDIQTVLNTVKQPVATANTHTHTISTGKLHINVVTLTPELAKALLSNIAPNQRKLRSAIVNKYSNDITHGRWRVTGEPIQLNPDGSMINGQHRCAAVVAAGIAIPDVIVITLLDDTAYEAMDLGAVRTVRDIVKMSGGLSLETSVIAAILAEHLDYKQGTLTQIEQANVVRNFPWINEVRSLHTPGVSTSGMLAAAIRAMRIDKDESMKFFGAVFSNNPMIDGKFVQQAQVLSTWLYKAKNDINKNKSAEAWKRECAVRAIHAWNAYRTGKTMKTSIYYINAPVPEMI